MNRMYTSQEMAKIASSKCSGCGACCCGMGDTITLFPYDVFQLTRFLQQPFSELLEKKIALHVEDGLIIPHLKMQEETERCGFLQENGQCGIHDFRPDLCRLFPLGRNYAENYFQYFIIEQGCPMTDLSKVKISQWIGIPDMDRYEKYLTSWHYFVKAMKEKLLLIEEDEFRKKLNMFFLQTFYLAPYDFEEDYYQIFEERMKQAEKYVNKKAGGH